MTGYGQASVTERDMSADVIVRCVNGKHLKTRISLGFNMPAIVQHIEQLVSKTMTRGSVDVAVRLDWGGAGSTAFNERVITSYVKELESLGKRLGLRTDIRVDRVCTLPGAMVTEGVAASASDRIWKKLQPAVKQALARAKKMRETEGKALAAELKKSCDKIDKAIEKVKARSHESAGEFRERLSKRISSVMEEAGVKFDQAIVAREMIMYAERSNIAEEMVRMKAHTKHFLDTLKGNDVGRTLEFISQEMNREANTMASKSSDPELSKIIIGLRGEIDHIREQVLNLE